MYAAISMLVVDNNLSICIHENLSTCIHKNIAIVYRDTPLPDSKVYALYNVLVCMRNVNDDFQILSILHRVTIGA